MAGFRRRFRNKIARSFVTDRFLNKPKIIIVGNPNVGKSVIFNELTKKYAVVSNYPGTTVEVSRGIAVLNKSEYEVIDTPGMYSLLPITEEERVARRILLNEKSYAVLHVVDSKNIERMMSFTLQLIEAVLPVILVLNVEDEARKQGIHINENLLEKELNIPVVKTVAIDQVGMDELKDRIVNYGKKL